MKKVLIVLLLISYGVSYRQKLKNLALTPIMACNSWNTFQTNINEQLIKDVADTKVFSGMKGGDWVVRFVQQVRNCKAT